MELMQPSQQRSLSIEKFKDVCPDPFRLSNDQHDSYEFLTFLLTEVSKDVICGSKLIEPF